jgi:hypothetical protein
MFNFDHAISEWRKQMLAAGIKAPVPLEELEIHLREEIEQQIESGLDEQAAFNSAVQKIGLAGLLRTEFNKAGGFIGWMGENKSARINRVLGALWLAYCSWNFFMLGLSLLSMSHVPAHVPEFSLVSLCFAGLFFGYIYLRGIIGSILLFGGITRDRRIIRMIALLGLVESIVWISSSFRTFSMHTSIFTIFNLVSIWFLRPPKKETPKPAGS